MEVVSNNYMPSDPRLIDHIVYELKSQGIFDNFRKECIADVDTKPAYQNLRQRVEGSVSGFLRTQQWRPDMNKNHVREMLRKNISESGFLETGVERIVDQVVNPKINSIFLPQVENVVYKCLGIQKPSTFDELKAQTDLQHLDSRERPDSSSNNLLPSDLETVSPESEPHERKLDISNESQKLDDSKIDEDESPPFEPLEESTSFIMHEENSVDSHLSGFSGLASHDSNHSFDGINKITPMEISNQDSQFSKQSSDDHLSIVMSDDTETKMEINEDSSHSKISKTTDSNSKNFDFMQDNYASSDKSSQSTIKQDKTETTKIGEDKIKGEEKKKEKHSSDKNRSRYDSKSDKDRKSDRDRKDSRDKSRHNSKDAKDKDRERKDSKSKSGKDERDGDSKTDKERKYEKDRDKSKSSSSRYSSSKDKSSSKKDLIDNKVKDASEHRNSKTKEPSEHRETKIKESEQKDLKTKESSAYKDSKTKDSKEKTESSKGKDDSKSKSESKTHTSTKNKGDSKNNSKQNGKTKTDLTDGDKNLSKSSRKDEKSDKSHKKEDKHHSRSDKYSSHKKDERRDKDKRDSRKDIKKISKDDHYSLKMKSSSRRSTDRDSSDGHSGTHSSASSFAESSTSSQLQKSSQDTTGINSGSSSGDSGTSDQADVTVKSADQSVTSEMQLNSPEIQEEEIAQTSLMQQIPSVKLIKPKFASNIFEARRLMKIRKKLSKIEKQSQMGLISTNVALKNSFVSLADKSVGESTCEIVTISDNFENNENLKRRPNILKKSAAKVSPVKFNTLSSKLSLNASNKYFIKNKTKPSNCHKRTYEKRKIEKISDSEEEDAAEVVEVSEESVPSPLQSSVISKESWDAVEAKLNSENLKIDYNSYTELSEVDEVKITNYNENSPSQSGSTIKETESCFNGFASPDLLPKTRRFLNYFDVYENHCVEQEKKYLARRETIRIAFSQKRAAMANVDGLKEVDRITRRLPKVAIVDVTSDSEIIISPSKAIKRHVSEQTDVHNNNKTRRQLEEDQLDGKVNHLVPEINLPTKLNTPKVKKAKLADSTVNSVDSFNLPLSPAESDKSFTTTGEKKSEKDEARIKRNSNTINRAANNFRNQRYSSDDLYKPRLQFSSSRRRAAKKTDTN